MKKLFVFVLLIIFFSSTKPAVAAPLWDIQAIDTMKFSRDISREPDVKVRIPKYVAAVASLSPSYIAIATPYDEEFYPVLKTWVDEARKNNLKVWFRGNFSSWEGWFGYAKFADYKEHHAKTRAFILNHPDLFKDGDIFTPAPEPENGGLGDPRGSEDRTQKFQEFLVTSYNTCEQAKTEIHKKFACGYFSTNGDVARESLTKDVVAKIGGVVVIDHYVKSPDKLVEDIKFIGDKYNATVILGEFGAPIPDIHGVMTEDQQATYIGTVLSKLVGVGSVLGGVNYWTAFGGSTQIFENNLTPRKVAGVISSYFDSPVLKGIVQDQFGNRIEGVSVSTMNGVIVRHTNYLGEYSIPIPGDTKDVTVSGGDGYVTRTISLSSIKDGQVKNVTLVRSVRSYLEAFFLSIKGWWTVRHFGVKE